MLKRHAVTLRGQEAKDEGAYTCPDMYQAVAALLLQQQRASMGGGPQGQDVRVSTEVRDGQLVGQSEEE